MHATLSRNKTATVLLIIVVIVRGVVDAGHHGVHLLGDGQDDGGAVAGDALLGEPMPELLHVLVGLDLVAVLVGSLEHEELADELEGVGDLLVVVGSVLELLDSGGAEAGDLDEVARDGAALEVGHGAFGHTGALGIISGFGGLVGEAVGGNECDGLDVHGWIDNVDGKGELDNDETATTKNKSSCNGREAWR
jgi:hypothetical protein